MKKNLFAILFLIPVMAFAQPFDFSSKTFNFPSVDYMDVDSMKLTLTNTTGYDISVSGIDLFSVYGTKPFYVKDSVFNMTVGNAHDVWIYFEPEQNILHQLTAVVKTDFRGDYLVTLKGEGHFSNSYYSGSYNKHEQDLKTSLKTITGQGYNSLSYSGARDNMYGSIDNVGGDVTCVYTGRVATFNTRPGANSNQFNCEHTFPQGFFNQNLPMRSDIHHLFSTDVTSNSQRGNYKFGIVTGNPSWSVGGSKKGSNGSQTIFEPRDAQKGQVARALFYFVLRYQDYSNHVQGQEAILRTWFDQYLPTAADIQRNNDIYGLQNNRNPFVDYPQLLKRIHTISGTSVAPSNSGLYVSRTALDMTGKTDSTLYTISIVNVGNTEVTMTDFRISNTTNFDFENAQSDRLLLPGEGFEIRLRVTPTLVTSVSEVLSFDTDVSGMASVDIQLNGGWTDLSTTDISKKSDVVMFPNPAHDQVSISWENHTNYEVRIFNVRGETVISKSVYAGREILNLKELAKGMYIVEISDAKEVRHSSLVID